MQPGEDVRFVYDLASHLGCSVGDVLALPAAEVRGWAEYLVQVRREAKAREKG